MVQILLDQDGSGDKYDEILEKIETGTDYDSIVVVTKLKGTQQGRPIVGIRFAMSPEHPSEYPGGHVPAEEVVDAFVGMSAREFILTADAIKGWCQRMGVSLE